PSLRWDADDGDLVDGGVLGERIFDLDRVHVLAAGHDHVLHPIDEVEVAAFIEVSRVARVIPAAAKRLPGLVRTVPVLLHQVPASRAPLAPLALRYLVALLVLDRESHANHRTAR